MLFISMYLDISKRCILRNHIFAVILYPDHEVVTTFIPNLDILYP